MHTERYPSDARTAEVSFLEVVNSRLSEIRTVLSAINERLNQGGFYAGPQGADSAVPAENHVRRAIADQLDRVHMTAMEIEQQIVRLV